MGENDSIGAKVVAELIKGQSALYGCIFLQLGDSQAAQDVLQETNVYLWEHIHELDSPANFMRWARTIAIFQVKHYRTDRLRESQRVVFDSETADRVAESLAAPEKDGREITFEALEKCLGKLPPQKRRLVYSRYWERVPLDDLAQKEHLSRITLSTRLLRIRQELGNCIRHLLCSFGPSKPETLDEGRHALLMEEVFDAKEGSFAEFSSCIRREPQFLDEWLDSGSIHAAIAFNAEKLRISGALGCPAAAGMSRAAQFARRAAAVLLLASLAAGGGGYFLTRRGTANRPRAATRQTLAAGGGVQQRHMPERAQAAPKTAEILRLPPTATGAKPTLNPETQSALQRFEQKETAMKNATAGMTTMKNAATALAVAATNAVTALTAGATDYTWLASPLSANWDTATANWNQGAWVNSSANKAVFGASSQRALTLDAVAAGGITVSGADYTFSGGTLNLEGPFSVGSGNSATVSSAFLQAGTALANRFEKSGAGTLTLHGEAGKTNTVYRLKQSDGTLVLDGGTLIVSGYSGDPSDSGVMERFTGGQLVIGGGATLAMTNSTYVSNGGGSILITNGTMYGGAHFLNAYDGGPGSITVQNNGTLQTEFLRITQDNAAADAAKAVINVNTGGTIRTKRMYVDENQSASFYATVNFDGGKVVGINVGDMSFFGYDSSEKSRGKWKNISLNVKKGGFFFDQQDSHNIWLNTELKSGDELDGGFHAGGLGAFLLDATNSYNGGTYLEGNNSLGIAYDRSLGVVPSEPTNNVFFQSETCGLFADNSLELNPNRNFLMSTNCLTLNLGAASGTTMRMRGIVIKEGESITNSTFSCEKTGKLILDPGDGKTNSLGRIYTSGNMEIASGTTLIRSSIKYPDVIIPLYIAGDASAYSDDRRFTVSGGQLVDAKGGYVKVVGYGHFLVTGGLANFKNDEILNAFSTPSMTTVSGTGILDCSTFRISQCPSSIDLSCLNLCTGGVLRLNAFSIDANGKPKGSINFNGGTLVAKTSTGGFLGTTDLMWRTNIFCYVREGGAIIDSNGYDIWIRNSLYSGAEKDGGLTKQGFKTLVLTNTNTYNGVTTVQKGNLSLRYPFNTLPPTNTLALCSGATCDLNLFPGFATQTLARVEGAGKFNSTKFLTVTGSLAPGDGTNGVGALTFDTACTLGGTLEIDGNETNSDCLAISSGVQDISALSLKFNDLTKLNKKKVYTIFSAPGGYSGLFASTNLGKNSSWIVRYDTSAKKIYLLYNAGTVVMLM